MPRQVHRVVQNPQYVDGPILFAADPEQNDVPATAPDMQRAHALPNLVAASRTSYGRPTLQTAH